MISAEFRGIIDEAYEDALRRGYALVSAEHITLFLITKSAFVRKLSAECRADVVGLRRSLMARLKVVGAGDAGDFAARGADEPVINFSRDAQRILMSAHKFVGGSERDIEGVHFLIAAFSERDSFVAHALYKHGLDRLGILAFVSKNSPGDFDAVATGGVATGGVATGGVATGSAARRRGARTGDKVEVDWVRRAALGNLERPLAMDAPLAKLVRILGRKYKNNPLIIGEPGVGKTSLVYALAHRIADGSAPEFLRGYAIMPVSMTALVAGTKYRGDFEQRVQQLIDRLRGKKTIAFVDEAHTLIGAGAVSSSALDAANMLKPLLTDGDIRFIGATTFGEYQRFIEQDAALARRFQTVAVQEPDDATLREILGNVSERLAAFHDVAFAPDCAEAAVAYSRRYMVNRFLPDKAIDLLDDTAARKKISGGAAVMREDVERAAIELAGLSAAHSPRLKDFEQQLAARVFHQPEATRHLAGAVLRGQLGYHNGAKTLGNYLFAGPTGVGKTEMAKQLAALLGLKLLRYDMSEYSERHTVSRLIGAPPGYVGFENSGRLIEEVFRHPNAVILMDEVEKAHPEVLNILLQVMDYGRLTDNNGRPADFSNAILILTSNLGAREMATPPAGFGRAAADAAVWREAVDKFFTPEFRNRLDAVIYFNSLSEAAVARIFDARWGELRAYLRAQKAMAITLSDGLRAEILRCGFSAAMGARPLERQLRAMVQQPLAVAEAQELVFVGGEYYLDLDVGGAVKVSRMRGGKPVRTRAVAQIQIAT